jgi:sortase (surface protein transpeptidase)
MRPSGRSGRLGALALLLGAAALLAAAAVRLLIYAPERAIAPPAEIAEAAPATSPSAFPARISIPAIAVDAKVDPLGIVAGNRMQAPSNFTDVGWYKYGVVPGEAGIAVMYAHLDNGLGLDGVFKNLNKLSVGDEIAITEASGRVLHFKVSDIETYPYQSVPPAAIGEGSGAEASKAEIVLITCAGAPTHDPVMGYTYDHRLVVTATLEPG